MPTKKDLLIFYILSFTWGLLWTLIGLIVFLFIRVFFYEKIKVRVIAGCLAVTFLHKRFGGINLGIVYFVDKNDMIHTHLHELGHSLQNAYFGPLFIPLIAIPSGIRYQYRKYLKKKKINVKLPSYDSIWFEGQATKLGYKYFLNTVSKKII
jgi:hypothetical protein